MAERTLRHRLDAVRAATADWTAVTDTLMADLAALGFGAAVPRRGTLFPPFALPDGAGHLRCLADLHAGRPLVLSFHRGLWCPYCREELDSWRETMPVLAARQVGFAAVTPETGGRAARLAEMLGSGATVLCDVDLGLTLASGLAFFVGAGFLRRYAEAGLDLAALYGAASGILPVPATFVVGADGRVRYVFADPDFRNRVDPRDVLACLDE